MSEHSDHKDMVHVPGTETETHTTHRANVQITRGMKLFLPRLDSAEADCIELRSDLNRALLGFIGHEGLYLWERRANTRHVLTWEELLKCYHMMQQDKSEQAEGE